MRCCLAQNQASCSVHKQNFQVTVLLLEGPPPKFSFTSSFSWVDFFQNMFITCAHNLKQTLQQFNTSNAFMFIFWLFMYIIFKDCRVYYVSCLRILFGNQTQKFSFSLHILCDLLQMKKPLYQKLAATTYDWINRKHCVYFRHCYPNLNICRIHNIIILWR